MALKNTMLGAFPTCMAMWWMTEASCGAEGTVQAEAALQFCLILDAHSATALDQFAQWPTGGVLGRVTPP